MPLLITWRFIAKSDAEIKGAEDGYRDNQSDKVT